MPVHNLKHLEPKRTAYDEAGHAVMHIALDQTLAGKLIHQRISFSCWPLAQPLAQQAESGLSVA